MELTKEERRTLLSCSLERVLNNAIWLAERAVNSRNEEVSERAGILLDDLEGSAEVKRLAVRLWLEAAESVRRAGPPTV